MQLTQPFSVELPYTSPLCEADPSRIDHFYAFYYRQLTLPDVEVIKIWRETNFTLGRSPEEWLKIRRRQLSKILTILRDLQDGCPVSKRFL